MGCVFSRYFESNSRTFYVWNVDSEGRAVTPGKIEVTDTQLILYQKENIVVRWPLTSLRRYGFDDHLFSFECGRRCTTGAGVYAFRCRRAERLFSILQTCINNSGGNGNNAATNNTPTENQTTLSVQPNADRLNNSHAPSLPNGSLPAASSPTVDSSGYLEPITANSHLHYPAASTSSRNIGATAGSPGGYVCIHGSGNIVHSESLPSNWSALPANGLSSCCSMGTCGNRSISASASTHAYVNNEVIEQSANCSNSMCIVNKYVNSSVIAADLAHRCCDEENENTYVNSAMVTLSPGHLCSGGCYSVNCPHCVDLNTNYAKLDDLLKQEQSAKRHKEQHFYVNVKPEAHSGSSNSSKCVSGRSTPTEPTAKWGALAATPTSPGSAKILNTHFYANLGSPPEPRTSKEQAKVNYAVLDLDQNEPSNNIIVSSVSVQNSLHSLTSSPAKSPEGYAQIDFDKTVALSNSANPCPSFNDDSIRKTRHNAVIPCASMSA